jgi:hypothetical protein
MTESNLHKCDVCGHIKITALVTFKQNVSFFFRRQERMLSGQMCFGCMTEKFVSFELITLIGTWWGIIGCLLGPLFILTNLSEYVSGCFLIRREAARLRLTSPPRQHSTQAVPPTEGGATPETAIRIWAANSIEGIPKEYAMLTAMFGSPNKDWKLIGRSLIHLDDGRKLEKFIIGVCNKRKEVYFDITEFMGGNFQPEVKVAMESFLSPYDRNLELTLPREELMILQVGVLQLTEAQLSQIGFSATDRLSMLNPLLDSIKPWLAKGYAGLPEHIGVMMMVSVWAKIMGLLTAWEPSSLLQEEQLENLKAIIGGALNAVQNGPPLR